jgi:pimeloyl-ACP methyl ester carboxylesterase
MSSTPCSIVLVHGAFADGSCWSKVIPLLEAAGHTVTAVQNPLTSIADDAATTRRVIEAQSGPVVVVGHSYGGVVITEAAANQSQVKALVYVTAFAPEIGEPAGALLQRFPTELGTSLVPDAAGFLYINRATFHKVFAGDLPEIEARVMAATQRPVAGAIFGEMVQNAAWKTIPAWYLIGQEDHAIHPDMQRFLAGRMGAQTTELKSSHVPFNSQPAAVAEVILQAAAAV